MFPKNSIDIEGPGRAMAGEVDDLGLTWVSPLETKFRRAVRAQNRFVNFSAILGVPAVVGIWLSVANRENVGVWPFWIVLGLLIGLQVVLYFVATLYDETVPELHLEKTELTELQQLMAGHIAASDDHIEWLEAAN